MKKKKGKTAEAAEIEELLAIDSVAAGERYRQKFSLAVEQKIHDVNNAIGDEQINKALLQALEAWRLYYAFSHALSEASGRRIYEIRWTIGERLSNDYLKKKLVAAKHGPTLAPVEIPASAKKILAAIEAQRAPKVAPAPEAEGDEYVSITGRR